VYVPLQTLFINFFWFSWKFFVEVDDFFDLL
jgi:hypothetical protein